jgi:hypothetical protein
MFDKALEFTLFGTTYEVGVFTSPLAIATAVAIVVVVLMATIAFTMPRRYQQWFVPVLWLAFAVAAGGSAYCWGVSAGIVEAFDRSQDLDVALTIHDLAAEWRLKSLWFSLGFLAFCVLHVLFGYAARWAWLRAKRKQDEKPGASDAAAEKA